MLRTGCTINEHMLQECYGTCLGPDHLHQLPVAIAQPTESVYQQVGSNCQRLFTVAGQVGVGMILQQAGREVVVKKLAAGWAPK